MPRRSGRGACSASAAVGSRFEARASGLLPLVGREQEVALLLDRWQQARDGEGQVVLLSGEPGIGKSRIARALGQRLAGEPHVALWHQCSPYYVDTALHPAIEHLERAAGFQRDDPPAAKLDKLEALLARGTDRAGEAAPLIAALLSDPAGGALPAAHRERRSGRGRRRSTSWSSRWPASPARQPVLCVFEDLHWADPTTLELLDRLVGRIAGERVLLLLTFRPEFPPPWRGRPHATLISLNRLPRRQSAALAEAVAGGEALPDAVLQQIVARADGVPLFLEELTKAVLEAAGDTPEPASDRHGPAGPSTPAIPATLQDSLMARLDRLAGAKEVAQIGAVIGREFGYELLAAVSPLAEGELRDGLGAARRLRAGVRPGRAANGDLHLQARPGAGRGLCQPAQEPAPAAAREHRPGAGRALAGGERLPGPSCSPTTSRRPAFRTRRRPTGSRPGGPRSAARR